MSAAERRPGLIECALEAVVDHADGMPVAFVPCEGSAIGNPHCTPEDIAFAEHAVAEGAGTRQTASLGKDRWVRVFPLHESDACSGHVVVLGRGTQSVALTLRNQARLLTRCLQREEEVRREREQLERQLKALQAQGSFHHALHQDLFNSSWLPDGHGSLQRIVSCLARHLEAPVSLLAPNLTVLAEAGAEAGSIASWPTADQATGDVATSLPQGDDVHVLPALGSVPRRLVLPVRNGDEIVAILTTTSTIDDAHARQALLCASSLVALERVTRAEVEDAEQLDRDTLLRDLFTGNSLHFVRDRGLRLNVDLRPAHFPCVFSTTPQSPEHAAHLRSLVVDGVRASVSSSAPALVALLDDVVVALIPEDEPDGTGRVCDHVIASAAEHSLPIRAGIGPLCRDVADYKDGVHKGRRVTEVLVALGGRDRATFDDLGFYGLFDREHATRLDDMVAHHLGPLISYDEAHKTDLVNTLRVLLDNRGVLTEAARKLHLHISTLKYRVNRIQEILAVDVRDPQIAFNLQLAQKVHAVNRMLRSEI